ncbi:MAG: hypothetical protein DMG58_20345 [Acidobacteria bacterium]|nr:MAG: hypothetical protein DMG58_20345 [Acidobacteriota bacterium]
MYFVLKSALQWHASTDTSIAWCILAGTIDHRTYQSDDKLRPRVASIWGSPQEQGPPSASYVEIRQVRIESQIDGHKTTRLHSHSCTIRLPLDASRINVTLALAHRQKGLQWYSTYIVDFAGVYTFHNPTADPQLVTYAVKFPAEHAINDGLVMEVDGHALSLNSDQQGVSVAALLAPKHTGALRIAYRSHGLESCANG